MRSSRLSLEEKRKRQLRNEALRRRDALSDEQVEKLSRRIAERLFSTRMWQQARAVLSYYAFNKEVRTREIMERALAEGKKLALPRINKKRRELELFWVPSLDPPYLAPGTWKIHEPVPELCERADPHELDLLLVPGVAFDRFGGRIGYGGGYYDRLLNLLHPDRRRCVVGLAFEVQIVDGVPLSFFDFRVPVIITEQRIIRAADCWGECAI